MPLDIPKEETQSFSEIHGIAGLSKPDSPALGKELLGKEFHELAGKWRSETRILSSVSAKIFNPHYQRIIGMGRPALPFIFAELRDRGGFWYWALECICGENPAAESETLPDAKRVWLEYARRHGYL